MSRISEDERTAVLLTAVGGPNSLDEVGPFLLDVRGGRPTSDDLVNEFRERYRRIGGKSPLLDISRAQANALEGRLNGDDRVVETPLCEELETLPDLRREHAD